MPIRLFGVIALFFSPALVFAADVMFEGYYRIELSRQHIGYAILRYEFEPKDRHFRQISFLRIKIEDKIIQESLKATTNDKFQPLSYQYSMLEGTVIKAIDGTFKGEVMTVKITDGKKVNTEQSKLVKGTFFASFLNLVMLQRPLPVGQAFQYSAIAEEEGGSYNGKALVEAKEVKPEYEILKIVNAYKGDRFISRMAVVKDPKDPSKNIKGEVLSTISPIKGLSTELMANPSQATENQLVPNKILVTLFGNMPTGKINLLNIEPAAKTATLSAGAANTTATTSAAPAAPPAPAPPKKGK